MTHLKFILVRNGLDMAICVYDLSTWDAVEGELGTLDHPQLPNKLKAIPKPSLHETLSQNKEKKQRNKTKRKKKETKQKWMSTYFFSN